MIGKGDEPGGQGLPQGAADAGDTDDPTKAKLATSVPSEDSTTTGDERSFDKPDDKQDDKRTARDPALATVIDAWPHLPDALRAGIMAMVKAAGDQTPEASAPWSSSGGGDR